MSVSFLGFDAYAFDISRMLEEGRRDEAIAELVKQLRAPETSEQIRRIAADQLADLWATKAKRGPPKKRGRPKKLVPPYWQEIGWRSEQLKWENKQRPEIVAH